MINQLYIKKFRAMEDFRIPIAPVLTAIAGQNATGKSTLLGIIGNSFQLPAKYGKTVLGKAFKTEFSEILNGSKQKDSTGIIGEISVSNISELEKHVPDKSSLRVAWQTEKGMDRFRIIPKRYYDAGYSPTKASYDERKYTLPSYYLGLSRLYPLGEVAPEKISRSSIRLTADEFNWYTTNYKKILDLREEIQILDQVKVAQKQSVGITTDSYDYFTNSAGEDNLSQILMSILSFKRLRDNFDKNGKHWDGGVLLIDEIDATLHPSAKEKLINFIYQEAQKIGIQVIFTTHSLSILRIINRYVLKNKNCNIIYLTTANIKLQMLVNPNFEMVENDMTITSFFDNISEKQVSIYSEDAEARWFIKRLLSEYSSRIRLVKYSDGCTKLLSLLENDPDYFKNILFIFDGDMKETSQKYKNLKKDYANIIKLPGTVRPESVIYNYLINLDSSHPLLIDHLEEGFTVRKIENEGPFSEKYSTIPDEREKFKHWFNDNLDVFNSIDLYKYWAKDNQDIIEKFIADFKTCFNIVASRQHIPRIN